MKKTFSAGLAILLLATSILSGCILVADDDGYRHRDSYERDHHRDHHDRHEDHDDR